MGLSRGDCPYLFPIYSIYSYFILDIYIGGVIYLYVQTFINLKLRGSIIRSKFLFTLVCLMLFIFGIQAAVFADYVYYSGNPYTVDDDFGNVSRSCCPAYGAGSQTYTLKIQGIDYNTHTGSIYSIMAPCQNVCIGANYGSTVDKFAYRLDISGSGGCPNPETRWEVLGGNGGKIFSSGSIDYFDN